jgi:Na+-driven multidrug efflux pump
MFGEQGISYGMGLSFMISSVFAFLYYRYGKWDKKAMIQN